MDKDALQVMLLIISIASNAKDNNMTLGQKLEEIYSQYGYMKAQSFSFQLINKEHLDQLKEQFKLINFENADFSFSGIKTAVINLNHKIKNINKANLCASFQKAVTEELIENVKKVLNKEEVNTKIIALAGGVSANSYIRKEFLKLEKEGYKIYMPDLKLCTDNAAMIASAGFYNYMAGKRDDMNLNAVPNLKLNS